MEIRLDTKRRALERYYSLLENAENIEQIVLIQQQIDTLTMEIESYEGQLKYWNTRVSESTITLDIYQQSDPNKVSTKVEWDSLTLSSMGTLIKNGFITVVNTIVSGLQWLLIGIVALSPIIIIGAIVMFIACKIVKKHRKEVSATKSHEDSQIPSVDTTSSEDDKK